MSLITPGMSPFKGAIGLRAVAFFMMVGLLAGCGGSNTAASSSASGSTAVTATIGLAGGTVTGPDGVQVVIPPGALTADTTIGMPVRQPVRPPRYPMAARQPGESMSSPRTTWYSTSR